MNEPGTMVPLFDVKPMVDPAAIKIPCDALLAIDHPPDGMTVTVTTVPALLDERNKYFRLLSENDQLRRDNNWRQPTKWLPEFIKRLGELRKTADTPRAEAYSHVRALLQDYLGEEK